MKQAVVISMMLNRQKLPHPTFHLSGKCSTPVWPSESLSDAWWLFNDVISSFSEAYGVRVHSFVLMSNHYHLLCSCPDQNKHDHDWRDSFHWAINFDFDHGIRIHEILETGEAPEPVFKDPLFAKEIEDAYVFKSTYAYIYQNPVKAGIVKQAKEYPYSTLPYVLGQHTGENLRFHCVDLMNAICAPNMVLDFIQLH